MSTVEIKKQLEMAGPIKVGQRVRRIRERQGVSIRELASRSEVSKNTLLRLELGQGSHLATVKRVSRALGVRVSDLVSDEFVDSAVIGLHHEDDWLWYDLQNYRGGAHPITKEEFPREARKAAANALGTNLFALLKSRMPEDFFHPSVMELYRETETKSHPGEEFCFVLQGKIRVHLENQVLELDENDSCTFYASERHSYEPVGDLPARVLSIILFFDVQNWHHRLQGWEK